GNETTEGGAGLIHRTEHCHGLAPLSHLQALAPLDPAQVSGEVLAELTDADTGEMHVYAHCSTSICLVTDLVALGVVHHRSRPFALSAKGPLNCTRTSINGRVRSRSGLRA